jgi:hypothetical protein
MKTWTYFWFFALTGILGYSPVAGANPLHATNGHGGAIAGVTLQNGQGHDPGSYLSPTRGVPDGGQLLMGDGTKKIVTDGPPLIAGVPHTLISKGRAPGLTGGLPPIIADGGQQQPIPIITGVGGSVRLLDPGQQATLDKGPGGDRGGVLDVGGLINVAIAGTHPGQQQQVRGGMGAGIGAGSRVGPIGVVNAGGPICIGLAGGQLPGDPVVPGVGGGGNIGVAVGTPPTGEDLGQTTGGLGTNLS